jgi:rhamnogalacturonyl hydrolase YesR
MFIQQKKQGLLKKCSSNIQCITIVFFLFLFSCTGIAQSTTNIQKAILLAAGHYKNATIQNTDHHLIPRSINKDGTLKLVKSNDWCSGFFAGSLWYLYDLTADMYWEQQALQWTRPLAVEQYNKTTHDLGFMIYNSYGNAFKHTKDSNDKNVIIQAAKSIASRFNPKVGVMRSWDRSNWQYPVIIDNMMNLELLFEASKLTGDNYYRNIAIRHANKDMQYHFRDDYSSYHLVDYDTLSGMPIKKQTHQGYNDASAWARGQAWALYGFTTMYRYTKDNRYLQQAEGIAHFILSHPHWPKDHVPYWDFDHPEIPNTYKDASAAAIIASALVELSEYTISNKNQYRKEAVEIIKSLSSIVYSAPLNTNNNFILMHCVGNLPAGYEIDAPINYADYYYLETLVRFKKLGIQF